MSFERTASGLSNASLFYGVDAVVFIEGRELDPGDEAGTLDRLFWSHVFEVFAGDTKVRIKERGSKTELLKIAERLIAGEIANTIVALDRDYDFELGYALKHPSIVYTEGYSWENDVWDLETTLGIVEAHSLARPVPASASITVREAHHVFMRQATRVARVNLSARLAGMESVVTTDSCRGLVEAKGRGTPKFNRKFFGSRLSAFNGTKQAPVRVGALDVDGQQHLLGHLLAYFCSHLAAAVLQRLGHKQKASYEILCSSAIGVMAARLRKGCAKGWRHYSHCIPATGLTAGRTEA